MLKGLGLKGASNIPERRSFLCPRQNVLPFQARKSRTPQITVLALLGFAAQLCSGLATQGGNFRTASLGELLEPNLLGLDRLFGFSCHNSFRLEIREIDFFIKNEIV
jgi:hypothetical protein